MSESNNNIPMRITQLEEATSYPESSYIPIAKAGYGTKKILSDRVPNWGQKILGVSEVVYIDGKMVKTSNPLTMVDGHPVTTDTSSAWKCAIIQCQEGDIFTINGASNNHNLRGWFFATSAGAYILESANPFSENNNLILKAPANSAWLILNSNDLTVRSYIGRFIPKVVEEINENIETEKNSRKNNDTMLFNAFSSLVNNIEIAEKEYKDFQINNVGEEFYIATSTVRKCAVCEIVPNTYINVKKLQTRMALIGFTTEYPKAGTKINTIKDWNGLVNTDIGLQAGANDNYLVVLYHDSQDIYTDEEVKASMHIYYSASNYGTYDMLYHANDQMINLLKYRPIGRTTKPYIALSCDDGADELATYTIPRMKEWKQFYNKNIPITYALFDNSEVFQNQTYTDLVTDTCENDGCSIAIHGTHSYGNYNRIELVKYLKKQESTIIEKTGFNPTSIIYPEHYHNDEIQTICGSFYGACGCGGIRYDYVYSDLAGRFFYNGDKSNCYQIYRLAIHDMGITSLEVVEEIVDFAFENNYIICPYWHDIDLDGENKDFLRAVLDKFVSYGVEKEIDFVTIGDIPMLI